MRRDSAASRVIAKSVGIQSPRPPGGSPVESGDRTFCSTAAMPSVIGRTVNPAASAGAASSASSAFSGTTAIA